MSESRPRKRHSPQRRRDAEESRNKFFLCASAPLWFILLLFFTPAAATPVWKVPEKIHFGELAVLELREDDPAAPTLPRPPLEDRVGPFRIRAVEAARDGRGWRISVQALSPGIAIFPRLDLGDGRSTSECRVLVQRTAPFGGMWMAIGGGATNDLPLIHFPWAWVTLMLLPPASLAAWCLRRWLRSAPLRTRKRLAKRFGKAWPPGKSREELDQAHALGRELLANAKGEAARAWGPKELKAHHLESWALWAEALDQARFGGHKGNFPTAQALLTSLERSSATRLAEPGGGT